MSTSSSDSENESSQAGPSRQLAPSSDENDDNLTTEQVEKLVQLQDLTGIEDTSICRALLESKNWDLEATAREQFGERDPPPPPPPLRPHDEAPELRQRLFGQPPVAPLNPRPPTPPVNPRGEGGTIANILRLSLYWVTLPVHWPLRLAYNIVWSLATYTGLVGPTPPAIAGGSSRPASTGMSPIQEVRRFKQDFQAKYGDEDTTLEFHDGTYAQALETAKKDLKFLIVYLHSASHQDTDRFCRQTMCNPQFTAFLEDKILFGVSIETHEGYRVSQAVRVNAYPLLAVIVLRQNRMMIVGRQEGFADPETLVQKLNDVVANNEAFVVAARADRAERDMNQAIREEQDAAFQETLRQDREKERVKRESEEAKRREAEEAEAAVRSAQERQEKIRQAKIDLAARVQPEPDASHEDVTRILIKLPGGQRLERRFLRSEHTLEDIFLYVFCHPDSPDDFDITTNFPRRVLPCKRPDFYRSIGVSDSTDEEDTEGGEEGSSLKPDATLLEAGIGKSEMLFITDLEA